MIITLLTYILGLKYYEYREQILIYVTTSFDMVILRLQLNIKWRNKKIIWRKIHRMYNM